MRSITLSRREVLAGIAGATGVGVAAGSATAALTSDEEEIEDTLLAAGALDLRVAWETADRSGTSQGSVAVPLELTSEEPAQTVRLTLSLPPDTGSNPAGTWLRSRCPPDDRLARQLDVTLRYADCDGDCEVFSGSVADLANGVRLDAASGASADDPACLKPGEGLEVALDVDGSAFRGRGETTFTLDVVGIQCRHGAGATSPFPATPCDDEPGSDAPAISYIAFCTTADGALDPEVTVTASTADGPDEVAWETTTAVDLVCVKAGTTLTVYDYRSTVRTSGTAKPGDPAAARSGIDLAPGEAATPCSVGWQALGETVPDDLHGTKLEYEDGTWTGDEA
ncbi:hypothetical protein ACKVMT_17595 [Halobacteriales archaeon Cl-PHB]